MKKATWDQANMLQRQIEETEEDLEKLSYALTVDFSEPRVVTIFNAAGRDGRASIKGDYIKTMLILEKENVLQRLIDLKTAFERLG